MHWVLFLIYLLANIGHRKKSAENKKPRWCGAPIFVSVIYFFAFAAGAAGFAAPAAAAAGAAAVAAGAVASSWRNARVVTTDTIGIRGELSIS